MSQIMAFPRRTLRPGSVETAHKVFVYEGPPLVRKGRNNRCSREILLQWLTRRLEERGKDELCQVSVGENSEDRLGQR